MKTTVNRGNPKETQTFMGSQIKDRLGVYRPKDGRVNTFSIVVLGEGAIVRLFVSDKGYVASASLHHFNPECLYVEMDSPLTITFQND